MTKISELKQITDPVKAAEADHEGSKLALRITPLATFLLEAGLHQRIGGTKTRAATNLFEAAIQDWAETQGIDIQSEEFRSKYLRWLTRQPYTLEMARAIGDYDMERMILDGAEVYDVVTL